MVGPIVVKRLRDEGGTEYALKGLSRYLFGAGKEKSNKRRTFTSYTPSGLLDAISEKDTQSGIKRAGIMAYKLLVAFATQWRITDFGRSPIFTQVTAEIKRTRKMYIEACNAGRLELELSKREMESRRKKTANTNTKCAATSMRLDSDINQRESVNGEFEIHWSDCPDNFDGAFDTTVLLKEWIGDDEFERAITESSG